MKYKLKQSESMPSILLSSIKHGQPQTFGAKEWENEEICTTAPHPLCPPAALSPTCPLPAGCSSSQHSSCWVPGARAALGQWEAGVLQLQFVLRLLLPMLGQDRQFVKGMFPLSLGLWSCTSISELEKPLVHYGEILTLRMINQNDQSKVVEKWPH